jgi:uncharacterized protein YdaU (DUF1376 family)
MNYYRRFVGDFQSKTGDLSMAEVGAYDRLLDHYYSTERPLPCRDDCYRICRAMLRWEKQCVDKVLDRFFVQCGEGFTQDKVERVIILDRKRIEASRANGKFGGRPRSEEPETNPAGSDVETQPVSSSPPSPTPALNTGTVVPVNSSLRSEFVAPEKTLTYSPPPCPTTVIAELYAKHLPMLPSIAVLTATRRKHIGARWKEVCLDQKFDRDAGIAWFEQFFTAVAESKFLTGKGPANRQTGRVWQATFDWLFLPTNFVKIVEGRYLDQGGKP